MARRSSYRLGRRLKNSRKARLDYITYLQSGAGHGNGTGGGDRPGLLGRLRFALGGAMRAGIKQVNRKLLAVAFNSGGATDIRLCVEWQLATAPALGGNFRANIFPPVTVRSAFDLGGALDTNLKVFKRLTAHIDAGGAMDAAVGQVRQLGAVFGLEGLFKAGVTVTPVRRLKADMALGGGMVADVPVVDPDAQAIIDAMTVTPSASRQSLINKTVKDLKTAGVWDKLHYLNVLAAHHNQAARIDWTNPTRVATAVSSPVFTADVGYHSAGAGSYLNTLYNFAGMTASHGFTGKLTNEAVNIQYVGGLHATNVSTSRVSVGENGGIYGNLASDYLALRPVPADGDLPFTVQRNGSKIENYTNGVKGTEQSAATVASTFPASSNAYMLAYNLIGTGARDPLTETDLQFAAWHGALTLAEVAAFHSVINTYLNGL